MGLDEQLMRLTIFIFYRGAAIFLLMSAFTENDLRHSATLLHKLNNLKDGAINCIEVDYAELVTLRQEDKLKAGCYYRIVDY